jgi:peptidyl-prolyl cis-trans isomerase C
MKSVESLLLTLLLVLFLLPACAATTPVSVVTPSPATAQPPAVATATPTTAAPELTEPAEPLAVVINGEPITLADYERQVALYEADIVAVGQDPTTPQGQAAIAQGRQWVLDLMIGQLLTEQAAAAQGIVITDEDVDAAIDSLRQDVGAEALNTWLAQQGFTLEEMRERLRGEMISAEIATHIADTAVPVIQEHVAARHILVATEAEARRILDQLQAGADFASTARTYSQDISTRDLGGDLGFFPKGILTSKEVEAAAFALQPGQLSDVVVSELGYHIVQVVDRLDQEISPENLHLLREQVAQAWLEELRVSATIQVFVTP